MLLPKHEIAEKLTAAEKKYLRKGPEICHEDFENIEPVAIFDLDPSLLKTIKTI